MVDIHGNRGELIMIKKHWKDIIILVLIVALGSILYITHESKQEAKLNLLMNRQTQIINALQGKQVANELPGKKAEDRNGKQKP